MRQHTKRVKFTAWLLLVIMVSDLIKPLPVFALTTGPSQPEVHGFEPVGTTDMVDMFSGSFVYNIPLMDVEGYPVNISYHGGVGMEQEASWVGLGWNINPGAINRTVRGVPDDFNGDIIARDFNIKDEQTMRVGEGGGAEFAGVGDPQLKHNLKLSLNAEVNLNISNYRGVSCDYSMGGGINIFHSVSAGVNVGVGSQTGASIDYNATLSRSASQFISKDIAGGVGVSIGTGYNTRSGLKDFNFSISGNATSGEYKTTSGSAQVFSSGDNVPIGVKNYIPVITNSSTMSTIHGRIKLGGELFSVFGYGNISAMYSQVHFNNDASRDAYGYLYLQNAKLDNSSIMDFTRDKDGMFNKSMQYLPPPSMTYDIYSVSGQGTGGVFRPFRNDFGSVYDPYTTSKSTSTGGVGEAGFGNLFEVGVDLSHTSTEITSGPWDKYQRSGTAAKGFAANKMGSIFENVYFKQAGELTGVDSQYFGSINGVNTLSPDQAMNLPQVKPGSLYHRDARANLIHFHAASDASTEGVALTKSITSYDTAFTGYSTPSTHTIRRVGTGNFQRKKDQVSEVVQTQTDGRRYIYSIPAINNVQREVTFAVDTTVDHVNLSSGTITFNPIDVSRNNPNGIDNYYNSTVTPSFAHSYLLSAVLSTDYVDVTGNGISDDDLGSFTKFNYTRTDSDYRWVAPFSASLNTAQYNPGFWSDTRDDKASFLCGSREQWNLHSIETKNFIAEFYISPRSDAQGITAPILNGGEASLFNMAKGNASLSYRLDSIKLYNKHDRFRYGASATPIKTTFFLYDYSLCPGIPNSGTGGGKLTLKKIYFRYGNSQKSMISPYQFSYANNQPYNLAAKDRWGSFKPNHSSFTNYEYPYVDQNDTANNTYSSAWSLSRIKLPSGGVIQANYESNDYGFVQDKPAAEMLMVKGIGNSPAFINGNSLYNNEYSPNSYIYFARSIARELPTLSFAQNYLGTAFQPGAVNCVYFNFNLQLTGANNTYEQVKGYGSVTEVGICSNNAAYGYIKFTPVSPTGGGGLLNTITYTALNTARYNLPQIIFPGNNPGETDMHNMLAGLKIAFGELASRGKSPVLQMVIKGFGREVDISKSYIRLQSPGLCKKGGGQRVKSLYFFDQWSELKGGDEQTATYGKQYDYTVKDPLYGTISSGVTSYEPLIGGDENPLRMPVKYTAQSAVNWPSNDAVDLYQETPIGESLFPGAQIGYSLVTVKSIHSDVGKSSQGVDLYQFYTARNFPAEVVASSISSKTNNHYDFFSQSNVFQATQAYTLIFNNMHGKPKKVEHDVYNTASQTLQPISYQIYNYRHIRNKLSNLVPCIEYNGVNMVVHDRQVGVEEDVTLDSREKNEATTNTTANGSVNVFLLGFVPITVGFGFTWSNQALTQFHSAVVGKVVQQYGILDNVVSYNEGAVTTVQNEVYDPVTGQAVVTSVNNEYKDKEYSTSIPASWIYKGMGPAYTTIGYKDKGTISVGANHVGTLNMNTDPLADGDQLAVSYKDSTGTQQHITAWAMGINATIIDTIWNRIPHYRRDTTFTLVQRDVYDTSYTLGPKYIYRNCFSSTPFEIHTNYRYVDLISGDSTSIFIEGTGCQLTLPHCFYFETYPIFGAINCPHFEWRITIGSFVNYHSGPSGGVGVLIGPTNHIDTGIHYPWQYGSPTFGLNSYPDYYTPGFQFEADITPDSVAAQIIPGAYDTTYQTYISSHTYDTLWHYRTDTSYTYTVSSITPPGNCVRIRVLPRFPLNTLGWTVGTTLTDATIEVVNSGNKNMLNEAVESYTSMSSPISTTRVLNRALTDLISISAKTYADSNTAILHNYITNADTVNPYAIGERGLWRLLSEYAYLAPRNYTMVDARNSGLFNAQSMFQQPYTSCSISPYNYLAPFTYAPQNWHRSRTVTKWSPQGKEIENIDAIGNYSSALFGYNHELPVAIGSNMRQGELLADGFEDYGLLQPVNNIMKYTYSPFNNFGVTSLSSVYELLSSMVSSSLPSVAFNVAHTGTHSLLIPSGSSSVYFPINNYSYSGLVNDYNPYYSNIASSPYHFTSANEFLPFKLNTGKKYILSYWVKMAGSGNITDYAIPSTCNVDAGGGVAQLVKKSNIIDGWQQLEFTFAVSPTATSAQAVLPSGYYIDDVRVFPAAGNMKSFVYDPINERLMATLDENNFATLYEYDQEGNLVRVKKETTKGIMTVSESRSGNPL